MALDYMDMFRSILPTGDAFLTRSIGNMQRFWKSLAALPEDIRDEFMAVWRDDFPQDTRVIEQQEQDFGIYDAGAGLTEQDRRDRLTGLWLSIGGQDPQYIQDTLQAAGFTDAHVYEWWEDGTNPPVPRDPRLVLGDTEGSPVYLTGCGQPNMVCGHPNAVCGYYETVSGYLLVNPGYRTRPDYVMFAGATEAYAGKGKNYAGYFETTSIVQNSTPVPSNEDYWRYIVYVAGPTWPNAATIPAERRTEFEALVWQLFPAHLWIGMIVNYT